MTLPATSKPAQSALCVTVAFPLADDARAALEIEKGRQAAAVIWTTTPWTLPANLAIALHPEFEYSLVEGDDGLYVVATDLVAATAEAEALLVYTDQTTWVMPDRTAIWV